MPLNGFDLFVKFFLYSINSSLRYFSRSGSLLDILKPISTSFPEPSETFERITLPSSSSLLLAFKILFKECIKSKAVSTSVPSRSNNTSFVFH